MGFWMAPLLMMDVPASILTLVRDDLHVLAPPSGPGMKVSVNENERLTHCAIWYGKRTGESATYGGSEWGDIVEAINVETFSADYYGNTDNDRKEKKIETEWLPGDVDNAYASVTASGVTRWQAGWFAVRWVEMRGRAPVVFAFTADLRFHAWRIGTVVMVSTVDWQTVHGEKKQEPCRFVKRTDDGSGKLQFEAQGLNLSGMDSATGTLVPRRWAWIAPDHVADTYDTATVDDRQYCYLSDANGFVGAADNQGYLLP